VDAEPGRWQEALFDVVADGAALEPDPGGELIGGHAGHLDDRALSANLAAAGAEHRSSHGKLMLALHLPVTSR
jgi:hypothetical protein